MQANTITIDDDAVGGVDKLYERNVEELHSSTYVNDESTAELRDQVKLFRNVPQVNGLSRGVNRTSIKLTKDVAVPNSEGSGDIIAPITVEIVVIAPVGADPLIVKSQRNYAALLEGQLEADKLREDRMV